MQQPGSAGGTYKVEMADVPLMKANGPYKQGLEWNRLEWSCDNDDGYGYCSLKII